jgi:hypothetical protein
MVEIRTDVLAVEVIVFDFVVNTVEGLDPLGSLVGVRVLCVYVYANTTLRGAAFSDPLERFG